MITEIILNMLIWC